MEERKQKYIDLLKIKLNEADNLKEEDPVKMEEWKNAISMILDNLIPDPESKYIKQFQDISYTSAIVNRNPHLYKVNDSGAFVSGINKAKGLINSIIFGVQEGLI